MRRALLPALLTIAACTAPAVEDVAVTDEAIVGGRANATAHPAVGYLAYDAEEVPFCTATLVEESYVVTASHCLDGVTASDLVFGTGKFDLGKRRTTVKRCKANGRFRDTDATAVYDFAFCELTAPHPGVTPMETIDAPAFGATYVAVGYGQTDEDDAWSAGPRKQLSVRRVDPEEEELLEGLEGMFATTSTSGDACFGDSGGPLIVVANGKGKLAGILHAGVGDSWSDCAKGNFSLYAPFAKNKTFFANR